MTKKTKQILIAIGIPLLLGGLSALATMGSMDTYSTLNSPPLSPPSWLFPVVWTILYALMGLSSYFVLRNDMNTTQRNRALLLYGIQLVMNVIWPLIFFELGAYWFAFFWLVVLLILVIATTVAFSRISRPAALMLVPYILWLTFAAYLNLGVAILN